MESARAWHGRRPDPGDERPGYPASQHGSRGLSVCGNHEAVAARRTCNAGNHLAGGALRVRLIGRSSSPMSWKYRSHAQMNRKPAKDGAPLFLALEALGHLTRADVRARPSRGHSPTHGAAEAHRAALREQERLREAVLGVSERLPRNRKDA